MMATRSTKGWPEDLMLAFDRSETPTINRLVTLTKRRFMKNYRQLLTNGLPHLYDAGCFMFAGDVVDQLSTAEILVALAETDSMSTSVWQIFLFYDNPAFDMSTIGEMMREMLVHIVTARARFDPVIEDADHDIEQRDRRRCRRRGIPLRQTTLSFDQLITIYRQNARRKPTKFAQTS